MFTTWKNVFKITNLATNKDMKDETRHDSKTAENHTEGCCTIKVIKGHYREAHCCKIIDMVYVFSFTE